jgi:hypothetical protein
VTYACDRCLVDREFLWRSGEHFLPGGWLAAPEVRCERCRGIMSMVDSPRALGALVATLSPSRTKL